MRWPPRGDGHGVEAAEVGGGAGRSATRVTAHGLPPPASTRVGEEKDRLTAPVRRPLFSHASTRPGEASSLLLREYVLLASGEATSLLPASRRPELRIAVVPGGNKGIGFEVCRQLASHGGTAVLTARDETRGAEAVEKLRALGLAEVIFHQLDVTDTSSIATLVDFLKTRFGKLDILVNNAAIGGVEYLQELHANEEKFAGMDFGQMLEWMVKNVREPVDSAKKGVQTNYYGTKHVTEAVLPLLQSSSEGRIVNVSSLFGLLRLISNEEVRQELNDIDNLREERLDELLDRFLRDFEADALEARGWPMGCSAYKVAKAAMNSYSRLLSRRHPALRVNCVHPGYVKTGITMNSGVLTPEEGARNVVKVALAPEGGPTGKFFAEDEEASFV